MYEDKLKIKEVINAIGTVTFLGGNRISPEVLSSIEEISKVFVNMKQLIDDAGCHIAKSIGVESAYITNGAAAAIVLSVASYIVKSKPKLKYKLPDLGKDEKFVITFKSQISEFKYLIKFTGAKIKDIGPPKDTSRLSFKRALKKFADKTVAIVYFAFEPLKQSLKIEEVISIAHSFGIPVIVDAAAEVPPIHNFKRYLEAGADIVIFSGGKAIGSFSDTGLMLGKKEIINIAKEIGPHSEEIKNSKNTIFIGRTMKVSKEDIVATTVAVDIFLKMDESEFMNTMNTKCKEIIDILGNNTAIRATKINPPWYFPRPVTIPRVEVEFNNNVDANVIANNLKYHNPPIYCLVDKGKLYINPQCLRTGEEKMVSNAILQLIDREITGNKIDNFTGK